MAGIGGIEVLLTTDDDDKANTISNLKRHKTSPYHGCITNGNNIISHGKTFISIVPDGISVSDNEYGKCLIATKEFKKDSFMYAAYYLKITDPKEYSFVEIDNVKYEVSETHSVAQAKADELNGERQLYGFDGFMNHSCDPNVICPHTPRSSDHLVKWSINDDTLNPTKSPSSPSSSSLHIPTQHRVYYYTYAVKDIKINDEITCDYAIFDYACDGHEIEICLCKSKKCRGSMKGFKNMTLEQQVEILGDVDKEVFEKFLQDHTATTITTTITSNTATTITPTGNSSTTTTITTTSSNNTTITVNGDNINNGTDEYGDIIIVDVLKTCPPSIEIITTDRNNIHLRAKMNMKKDDVIFQNRSIIIPDIDLLMSISNNNSNIINNINSDDNNISNTNLEIHTTTNNSNDDVNTNNNTIATTTTTTTATTATTTTATTTNTTTNDNMNTLMNFKRHYILKIANVYKLLSYDSHFIHREGYYEMLGYDTFMNHSCVPSVYQKYISTNEYIVYAARDLRIGEELTCDYNLLDNQAIGMKSIDSLSMTCECGHDQCRGVIIC